MIISMLPVLSVLLFFFKPTQAGGISLGYPDPMDDNCSVMKPQSHMHHVASWLLPENVFCPRDKEGGSGCCGCMWRKDFLRKAAVVDQEFQTYTALADKTLWPYPQPARESPYIPDKDTWLPPFEADEIRHYTSPVPGWVKVSFKCRVTLSDDEFSRYFPIAALQTIDPTRLKKWNKLTRTYFTYCTPSEDFEDLYPDTERQYVLLDEEGVPRDSTHNFRCTPKNPSEAHLKPVRRLEGTKGKWYQDIGQLREAPRTGQLESDRLAWGSKGKRTHRPFTRREKKKPRRLQRLSQVLKPSSSRCQEIPGWRSHIGQSAQIVARLEPANTNVVRSCNHFAEELPYDPTVIVEPIEDEMADDNGADNYLAIDDIYADDSMDCVSIYENSAMLRASSLHSGLTDDEVEDDNWPNLDIDSDETRPEIEDIDDTGFDFDNDESSQDAMSSANIRLIATHSSQADFRTARILEESGFSNEAFTNIHATLTDTLRRDNSQNSGIFWEDLKISATTVLEACVSPIDQFAEDLNFVTQIGWFSTTDSTLAIDSP